MELSFRMEVWLVVGWRSCERFAMTDFTNSPEGIPRPLRRWMRLMTVAVVIGALVPLGGLISCQSRLIYFPRPYGKDDVGDWKKETRGKVVDYTTSQGKQRAFLQGNLKSPRNLWVFCAGNGTLALEWADWLAENAPKEDAWLLVDFPGYGNCEGYPSPGRIRDNVKTALPLAWKEVGGTGKPDPARLRFFGHSLGAASVMMAASEFGIQRGVLLAPFSSTMDMSEYMLHVPVGWLVWHRFDNGDRLDELAKRGPGQVIILHGTDDSAIPITMSRKLAAGQPGIVKLVELQHGDHNALPQSHRAELKEAIEETGR